MSRILRRPMFRGGRVDSRGTGIASGLSYNKGGRVGFSNGGSGEYVAKNLEDYKNYLKFQDSFKPQLFGSNKIYSDAEIDSMVDKGKFANRPWWDFTGMFDLGMGISGPSSDFIQGLQYEKTDAGKRDYRKELIDERDKLIKQSQEYGMSVPEGVEVSVAETPEEGESRAEFEERIKREAAEELQALIKTQTDKDPTEEIAKNKKIFEDAYGSGVADDASRMLMTLAAKGLKPGADTKSAFSDFFEEESKVPSESKKYKDAATTAAINAYLTGQSSFQKFEDQLKLAQAGIDMKLKAGQPKNLDEALEFFRKTGDKLTSPGLMAKAVDKIYGANTFAGPLPEDSTELIIGKVYYADDPNNASNKVLFLIDENQKPNPIKTVYK